MNFVNPKKKLGQHFLKDENVARKIVDRLTFDSYTQVLEIGPGMGILTQFISKNKKIFIIEIDKESIEYLKKKFPYLVENIIHNDFLKFDLNSIINDKPLAIFGNFPYNISTQILFKVLKHKDYIPFFCGMFQKEVAERICKTEGTKKYGIISVLVQAFYNTYYLFDVSPQVFAPPPKVNSGVIELKRKENYNLPCDQDLFFKIVKLSFQQRRKTIRNSLKTLQLDENITEDSIFDLRPEKLSNVDFIKLTQKIQNGRIQNQ